MENKHSTVTDKRTNDILLGPLERPALQFLARHMPAWVSSDMLTGFGLFGSVLTGFAYAMVGTGEIKGNVWLFVASLGFIFNWFGDSLDGSLARYRHQERPNYGYYIDHAIDGITALVIFVGMGLSGVARLEVTLFALVGYLLLIVQVSLKTHVTGVFEMTSIKLGPTEVRVLAIIMNTALFFTGIGENLWTLNIQGVAYGLTIGSIIVFIVGIIFLLYYIYQVIRTGIILAAEDEDRLAKRKAKEALKAKENKDALNAQENQKA